MVEKFADYEPKKRLDQEGEFVFKIDNAELTTSSKGNPMVIFDVTCDEGFLKLYMNLSTTMRWRYNLLIAACLNLTGEARRNFELDYETIHNQLVGKKFKGVVVKGKDYDKERKAVVDGLFEIQTVTIHTYEIKEFYPVD